MNYALLKLYLENPERVREVAHGLELAACAFQAQLIRKGYVEFPRQRLAMCRSMFDERDFGLEVAAANFNAQIRKLEAVSRDRHGHFYKPDGAACPHSDGGGKNEKSGNKQRPRKQSGGSSKKAKYGTLEKKLVRSSDSFKRINNPKGETIIAVDGKPAIFNSQSVKHVVFDHTFLVGEIRMRELDIAQDTTATGLAFPTINKGKPQTDFIKKYDIGGNEVFYYTSRRGISKIVYSWHSISKGQYIRKLAEYKKYKEGKK